MIQRIVLLVSLSTALIAGCAAAGPTVDSESMYVTASALTKLSASVESTVRYKNPPDSISDDGLLKMATDHDPSLLGLFEGYKLKVLREERHASVLVCSGDATLGLLEDLGCTAALDKHLWQAEGSPCTFTMSPAKACASEQ